MAIKPGRKGGWGKTLMAWPLVEEFFLRLPSPCRRAALLNPLTITAVGVGLDEVCDLVTMLGARQLHPNSLSRTNNSTRNIHTYRRICG